MKQKPHFYPLSPLGLGLAMGLLWGIAILLTGWAALFGWCLPLVTAFSSMYIGFSSGFLGGVIGAVWGFLHGFIKGAILAYFYNLVTQKFSDPY